MMREANDNLPTGWTSLTRVVRAAIEALYALHCLPRTALFRTRAIKGLMLGVPRGAPRQSTYFTTRSRRQVGSKVSGAE